MTNLVNGEAIVSLPRFEPRPYLQAIHRWRCTMLTGIPTMFALLARETDLIRELDLTSVKAIGIGSAPLSPNLLGRVREIFPAAEIINGYGTTEAGPAVFGPHPLGTRRPEISLGSPLSSIEWRLAGASADSNEGVFQMRSPAVMAGYLNLPDATARRVQNGWYDTGDIMRRDPNGFFYFVGRADDMFVCGGENIYPGEIEKLLETHPEVAQAVVVPAPDDIKGEIPVAFIVRTRGSGLTEEEVRAFTLQNGPAYRHPRIVMFKDELPFAGTFKVDRQSLLAEARTLAVTRGRATRDPEGGP
jgi:acyl-CoA synthetase (AMP-forming)/AMP-acid ligase II